MPPVTLRTTAGLSLALRGGSRASQLVPPTRTRSLASAGPSTLPASPPPPAGAASSSSRPPATRLRHRTVHTNAPARAAVANLTRAETAALFGAASGRAHAPPPYAPSAPSTPRGRTPAASAEYVPDDADFAAPIDASDVGEGSADGSFAAPLARAPPLPSVDARPPRRRRRARAVAAGALPPPLAASVPADGQTRFDWRRRAQSRVAKQTGSRWFAPFRRREAPPPPAEPMAGSGGAKLHAAIGRYRAHFLPLLQAEVDEVKREFEDRLYEWSESKMASGGYMRERMAAALGPAPRTGEGHSVTFRHTGKDDPGKHFDNHLLQKGANVVLCQTDPLLNPVLESGEAMKRSAVPPRADGDEAELIPRLLGRVQYVGKGTITVAYDVPRFIDFSARLPSGQSPLWRLDLAYDTLAFERQFEALDALAHDPAALDAAGYPTMRSKGGIDDVDAAMARELRLQKPGEEFALLGSGLRDVLLRRFQADVEPAELDSVPAAHTMPAAHAMPPADAGSGPALPGPAAGAAAMRPADAEATAAAAHLDAAPAGVLAQNQVIQSWARRYRVPPGVEPVAVEGDPDVPLNPSQKRAIAMMLSERLSLVQGPPGSGKTRVIVEAIKLLKVPHPILVCAHTNVAVDNLLEGFAAHGLCAVRYGAPDRVRPDLAPLTLDEHVRRHPLGDRIAELDKTLRELGSKLTFADWKRSTGDSEKEDAKAEIMQLRMMLYKMKRVAHHEVLAAADVVCTTCLAATNKWLQAFVDFPVVFLDEASMATEPLSLVPLTRGVAILGDHKQLPPVITSDAAQAGGLGISLFERLMHEHHVPSIMLDTQYRMHPSISAFSAATFYNGELKDGTVVGGAVRPGLHPPDTSFLAEDEHGQPLNVTFIDHDHREVPVHRSISNPYEARRVCDIVFDLLYRNPDLRGADIGVIAPYVAQIRAIRDLLHMDAARAARFAAALGPERAAELADVEVKTVDGFEGREKAVVVFSCTRANAAGQIGFLADWRRLNVGLTRAKRALIMLGSRRTLARARTGRRAHAATPAGGGAVWRALMSHLGERSMVLRDEVYEGEGAEDAVEGFEGFEGVEGVGLEEGMEAVEAAEAAGAAAAAAVDDGGAARVRGGHVEGSMPGAAGAAGADADEAPSAPLGNEAEFGLAAGPDAAADAPDAWPDVDWADVELAEEGAERAAGAG